MSGLASFSTGQYVATDLNPAGYVRSVARASFNGVGYGFGTATGGIGDHALIFNQDGSTVNLHPFSHYFSYSGVMAVDGMFQLGVANDGGYDHAALWAGSANTFVDLNPPGYNESYILGASDGVQVGWCALNTPSYHRACYWRGTATSMTLLHLPEFSISEARGAYGNQQVGFVGIPGTGMRAALWNGDPATWINLHPLGRANSEAHAIYANQQVGYTYDYAYSNRRAALWSGSAQSFVDLTPPGYEWAVASALGPDVQVGYGSRGFGYNLEALVWHGSASSGMSLSSFLPPGLSGGQAMAVDSATGDILGFAYAADGLHAVRWRPDDVTPSISLLQPYQIRAGQPGFTLTVNGHNFRPDSVIRWNGEDRSTNFESETVLTTSISTGDIAQVGLVTVSVHTASTGKTSNLTTFNILRTLVFPSSYSLVHGIPRGGNLASITHSDNSYLSARMNFETTRLSPKVVVEAVFMPTLTPSRIDVSLEASATALGITQGISVWNGTAWVQIDSVAATKSVDSTRDVAITNGTAAFVVNGQIRVRVTYFTFDRERLSAAEGKIDMLRVYLHP